MSAIKFQVNSKVSGCQSTSLFSSHPSLYRCNLHTPGMALLLPKSECELETDPKGFRITWARLITVGIKYKSWEGIVPLLETLTPAPAHTNPLTHRHRHHISSLQANPPYPVSGSERPLCVSPWHDREDERMFEAPDFWKMGEMEVEWNRSYTSSSSKEYSPYCRVMGGPRARVLVSRGVV